MSSSFSKFDTQCMQEALRLAWKGRYSTNPNPRVGCVIADENRQVILARGFHDHRGGLHAEIAALLQVKDRDLSLATVYSTLEPCSHQGHTGPCAKALCNKQVKRVVAAMSDPNPLVHGKGFKQLQEAGIQTECGLLEQEARIINRGFLSRFERQRPFVILKTASSLDGKIALKNGVSQWITHEHSRMQVQEDRAQSCAILTGSGTVLKDNPRLTVRHLRTQRQPIRIILDSKLRTPLSSAVIEDITSPTWLVTLSQEQQKIKQLQDLPHIRVIIGQAKNHHIDLPWLMKFLAEQEIGQLYVECGSVLAGALLSEGLIDEWHAYIAPLILGYQAKDIFFHPQELTQLSQANRWQIIASKKWGPDLQLILHSKADCFA